MPWHFKLGFTRGPCISTLHKLNADGGVVAALDFVIVKVRCSRLISLAFFENSFPSLVISNRFPGIP